MPDLHSDLTNPVRRLQLLILTVLLASTTAWGQPGYATLAQKTPSVGLFVGVNEFFVYTQYSQIRNLEYAVNDAVALAYLFVIDLEMVPPGNARLLLSGYSNAPAHVAKLQALAEVGVFPIPATKANILSNLKQLVDSTHTLRSAQHANQNALQSDLLVVSISSHGFEEHGISYVIPAEGELDALASTGINLKASVETEITRARVGKKLLLIDACRNELGLKGCPMCYPRTLHAPFTQGFLNSFAESRGQLVFYSGSAGQVSFEDHTLNQGVFTYFLLEAMGRDSPVLPDENGIIRLGNVVTHVKTSVEQWTIDHHKPLQEPSSTTSGGLEEVPVRWTPEASVYLNTQSVPLKVKKRSHTGGFVVAGALVLVSMLYLIR